MRKLFLLLLAMPFAANADLIDVGGYEDWEFDFSELGDQTVNQFGYSTLGEDRLESGASIRLEFGTAPGLSDLLSTVWVNPFSFAISNVGASISNFFVPESIDFIYARVSYVDDVFQFDNMRLGSREPFTVTYGRLVGSGVTSVPEPGTLALLGIGLLGMAAARRGRKV